MAHCLNCNKTTMFGRTHTHHRGVAGGRWKKRAPKVNRKFKANLQRVSIMEHGKKVQICLCGKCIKRIKKDYSEGLKPSFMLVNLPKQI